MAKTKKGSSNLKLSSPIVTCFSCMASNRALWTFAGERLISSARIIFAKIGPFFTKKSPSFWLYIRVPIRSAGSKSGVNCIRWKAVSITVAKEEIVRVFAKPGTPSNKTWPLVKSPIINRSIMYFCPMTTLSSSVRMSSINDELCWIFSLKAVISTAYSLIRNSRLGFVG